jgi:hypothetical protein
MTREQATDHAYHYVCDVWKAERNVHPHEDTDMSHTEITQEIARFVDMLNIANPQLFEHMVAAQDLRENRARHALVEQGDTESDITAYLPELKHNNTYNHVVQLLRDYFPGFVVVRYYDMYVQGTYVPFWRRLAAFFGAKGW